MEKVFIIAEAGVNHNGNLDMALELLDHAAAAGCDAIKFQAFSADELVSRSAPKAPYQVSSTGNSESQYEMLKRLEMPVEHFRLINKACDRKAILFLATGFSRQSVDMLHTLGMTTFKIPSGEITNMPYLQHVGGYEGTVILSTGMANMEEIGDALNVLERAGTPKQNITVLHCTTEYPAPFDEINLTAMLSIKDHFGVKVGYSDHSRGIEVSLAAVAMGASIIEKHFTLDKSLPGPDHIASIDPGELLNLVTGIRHVEQALGDGIKRATLSERRNIDIARRSLVASGDIREGEVFSENNLAAKRPGGGVSPMKYYEVLGTRAARDYKKDQMIEL
jgi:N,N'-diacetyllegionaminate synthase